MTTSAMTSRPVLSQEEQVQLVFHVAPWIRTVTLYVFALRFGLGARRLSALNIGDVSPDGRRPSERLRLGEGTLPLFAEPIGREVARTLSRYLVWRCSCVHMRLPLQTYRDPAGVERCHSCHDGMDLLANPLFIGRGRRRLSAKRMRHEFAEIRDEIGLDHRLSFDSMRLTCEAAGA
jgi:hypothetical protein